MAYTLHLMVCGKAECWLVSSFIPSCDAIRRARPARGQDWARDRGTLAVAASKNASVGGASAPTWSPGKAAGA